MQPSTATQKTPFTPLVLMGMVAAAIDIPIVISLSILIYSGDMAAFAPIGIGSLFFGGIISNLIIGGLSSVRGLISGPQDSPAAILALIVATISGSMAVASPEERFATVFVLISLISIITGLFFILAGKFNLSRFIRFIPYPVVGGFVAGTGLLLALGSLKVMTDISPSFANLGTYFQPELLPRWIFGAALGIILLVATRLSRKVWLVPAILGIALAIFYGYAALTGQDLEQLHQADALLGPFSQTASWKPLSISLFTQVNWTIILAQSTNLAAIIMISTVALLLNSSALELLVKEDVRLERELFAAGVANVIGGFGGSPITYLYLSISALPMRAGSKSRLNGVFAALVYLLALVFGASMLERIPKFMVGGLLLFLGLSFLTEWIYEAWKTLPRTDYALVLVIIAVIGGIGFLEGVGVGVLIAVILFAINYSRLDFVKNTLDGQSYRSNIERPLEHRRLIQKEGESVHILRLQGFLFFGTAQSLLNRIRERVNDTTQPKLRYLLLDFQRVTALDSSVAISFVRMKQLTESHQIYTLFTNLNPEIKKKLAQHDLLSTESTLTKTFASLDHGMEWCEDHILAADEDITLVFPPTLQGRLGQIFESDGEIKAFMAYLEKQELETGQTLIKQGDPSNAMYFIDSGELTAQLETTPGEFMRLRSMGGGTIVGEIGVYLQHNRTASIIASKASIVYALTEKSLEKMGKKSPELLTRLHFWNARQLSERLADNNRTIEALLD